MSKIVVFAGPSISQRECSLLVPGAAVCPPAERGDLYSARNEGADLIVLIDGSFAHALAVSPTEVVDVARDGCAVIGASSMGAIRAAECWPAGVRGIGEIYAAYRAGRLDSDDEVAVTVVPDREFSAGSVPLINLRAGIELGQSNGALSRAEAVALTAGAERLHFSERSWEQLLHVVIPDRTKLLLPLLSSGPDLKHKDAVTALSYASKQQEALLAHGQARLSSHLVPRPVRYPGHERFLGYELADARQGLLRWVFGTGRYQRYVWALVAGEPEFGEISALVDDRPGLLRQQLELCMRRLMDDAETLAKRLWAELTFQELLESELLRMLAHDHLGDCAARASICYAREYVSIEHGYQDWASLQEDVHDGRLYGAIPVVWIGEAADKLAAGLDASRASTET